MKRVLPPLCAELFRRGEPLFRYKIVHC
jgi:hypothetical protein